MDVIGRFNHCAKGTKYVSPPRGGGDTGCTLPVYTRGRVQVGVYECTLGLSSHLPFGVYTTSREKPCLGSGTLFNFLLKGGEGKLRISVWISMFFLMGAGGWSWALGYI